MANVKITDYTEVSIAELEDLLELVEDPAGTPTSRKVSLARLLGVTAGALIGGRLTLTSGTPVTTADVTAAGTLYYTPYLHNRIGVYDGTRWKIYAFSEISLALAVTSGYLYDVFVYDNAGTLTLEITEWDNATVTFTNATERVNWASHPLSNGDRVIFSNSGGAMPTGLSDATVYFVVGDAANDFQVSLTLGGSAVTFSDDGSGTTTAHSLNTHTANLTTQDGVYVKSGATTRRWLGTIRASGANTTEDSGWGSTTAASKRYVWNLYNQAPRRLHIEEDTASWTYSGTTNARQANAATDNQVEVVTGLTRVSAILLSVSGTFQITAGATSRAAAYGIGMDSKTVLADDETSYFTGVASSSLSVPVNAALHSVALLGYHVYYWIEALNNTDFTATFSGTTSPYRRVGLMGWVMA